VSERTPLRRNDLGTLSRARLASRIWTSFVTVHLGLRRMPLPELVERLADGPAATWPPLRPSRLSRAVDRTLRLGRRRPRCLILALVLYRLLRSQGDDGDVVIGLPIDARDKDAHAWIEIDGRDIGPPPGKGVHEELARYP
jgi:hypothetical protein